MGIWSAIKGIFVEEKKSGKKSAASNNKAQQASAQQGSNLAPFSAMLDVTGLSYEDAAKLVKEARKTASYFANSKLGDYKEGKGGTLIWDMPKWAEKVKKAANTGLELSRQQEDERTANQVTYTMDETSKVIGISFSARASAVCSITDNIIQAREGKITDHILLEGAEKIEAPYVAPVVEEVPKTKETT